VKCNELLRPHGSSYWENLLPKAIPLNYHFTENANFRILTKWPIAAPRTLVPLYISRMERGHYGRAVGSKSIRFVADQLSVQIRPPQGTCDSHTPAEIAQFGSSCIFLHYSKY
jgi:hypothetical protein